MEDDVAVLAKSGAGDTHFTELGNRVGSQMRFLGVNLAGEGLCRVDVSYRTDTTVLVIFTVFCFTILYRVVVDVVHHIIASDVYCRIQFETKMEGDSFSWCDLLPLKNLLCAKLRDYTISRVNLSV